MSLNTLRNVRTVILQRLRNIPADKTNVVFSGKQFRKSAINGEAQIHMGYPGLGQKGALPCMQLTRLVVLFSWR